MPAIRIFSQKSAAVIRAASGWLAGDPLAGKTVVFSADGTELAGVAAESAGEGRRRVKLCVPGADGVLLVTDSTVDLPETGLTVFDGLQSPKRITHFEARLGLEGSDQKFTPVYDGPDEKKVVKDYRDVSFVGYASTFIETTPRDRDGDYVMPGAFSDTLLEFRKNPVMLVDHTNKVSHLAGSYSRIGTDAKGLSVTGNVSNAPGMIDVRFLLAEGHLKTLSIGGFFYYNADGRGIEKVQLFEISLTPVPANPDAIVSVRGLTLNDCVKAYRALSGKQADWLGKKLGGKKYNPSEARNAHGEWGAGGASAHLKPTQRVGEGKESRLVDHEGHELPAHVAALKIPQDWKNVRVSHDPHADMLAQGEHTNARGFKKTKTIYSDKHHMAAAEAKFSRVKQLEAAEGKIVAANEKAMTHADPKVRDAAAVTRLIHETGIRPGSETDTGSKVKAHGATTLEGRHVVTNAAGATELHFVGKKGVDLKIPVDNPDTAKMIQERAAKAGATGKIFATSDAALRDHVHGLDSRFKPKDLRTLKASKTARELVEGMPVPKNNVEYQAQVKDVARKVSAKLGNTPTVALQSYIPPSTFGPWAHAAGDTKNQHTDASGNYTPERQALHAEIVKRIIGDTKPVAKGEKPDAILMMGAGGSGKSSMPKGVDTANYVHIDSDAIKAMLPEYGAMVKAKDKGAAAVTHEESGDIAKKVREQALGSRRNVLLDGTGANKDKYAAMIDGLKAKGYGVNILAAHIPVEEGISRASKRAKKSGRHVPEAALREAYAAMPASFAHNAPKADTFHLFNNEGETPKLAVSRRDGKTTVHDHEFVTRHGIKIE